MFSHNTWQRAQKFALANQALFFLIALAILGRLLPHPDNITPLAAIGVFAGAYLDRRLFVLVPLLAAFISDLLGPGIYSLQVMFFVYAGLMLSAICGRLILFQRRKLTRLPVTVVVSALAFYFVSNLGPWWAYYEHSVTGLLTCYANGIPYLFRTLAGDGMYCLIFFGLYESLKRNQQRRLAHA